MKYNWSRVPSWVEFITTDKNGFVTGWDSRPQVGCMIWVARHPSTFSNGLAYHDVQPYDGYWAASCEKRPDSQPVPAKPDLGGMVAV